MPKLTLRTVEALPPAPDGSRIVWEADLSGFGLRIHPVGRKTYMIQYRNSFGRSRRLTLGRHGVLTPTTARKQALQLLGDVERGEDPAEQRHHDRRGMTVREATQLYLDEHLIPKRKPWTVYTFRSLCRRILHPRLGSRKLASLTPRDVEKLHHALRETPTEANKAVDSLSAVLNFAERLQIRPRGSNPCSPVERYRLKR